MSQFQTKATLAYRTMIASYLSLLALLALSTAANPPESIDSQVMLWLSGIGIWVFKTIPLLILIPALINKSHKGASWLSYVVQLYFIIAVVLAFTPESALWGWLMSADTLIIFISSMMYTRWQRRVEAGL
ncbi:MAG: DUF2069 domain-containing protein [Oceanobacter sp.]